MKLKQLAAILLAAFALAGPAGAQRAARPLTVRVDASSGAPRLLIRGEPRRARVFWGSPSPGTLRLPEKGGVVSYEFTPGVDEPAHATMHLRFGHMPGDIFMDDIRITDLAAGKDVLPPCGFEGGEQDFTREWHVWPPAERNTVGTVHVEPGAGSGGSAGLHIHIVQPPGGDWPDFHIYHEDNLALVAGHRYRVSFWAKAAPARDLTTAFYRPGPSYVYLGGPPGHFESQIRLAASAGVDLVSYETPVPWPAPGEPEDWRAVDAICEDILRANPHALMIPRIGLYAPQWWKDAHPDELMRWEDGGLHGGIATPASAIYRRDAAARLTALVTHLERRFGEHMAGYHPTGQNTGEWFYMDSWDHPLNGYSPRDARAFRDWLRTRYGSEDALRRAWSDPSVDFDRAEVPSAAARHAAPAGIFRDPAAERPLIDFVEFQQESMAGCVCELAHAVRTASAGRKLVLFFYGYLFEFGPMQTGPACAGHYALRRVLSCPDIDVLCSPISYGDRGPLGSAPSMSAAESVALAGKMWLNEDDTRTYLVRDNDLGPDNVVTTLAATNGELIRNVAQEAMRNFATWWMDLGSAGWYDDPGMWAEMKRLGKIDNELLRHPAPFRPQVALVLDERTITRLAEGCSVASAPCVYESRAMLGRMGAPYGQYLLDDAARGRVHAKLYVFANAWLLTAAQRAALRRATSGAAAVWCYAPGWLDSDRKSTEAMRELTGFRVRPISQTDAWATPTAQGRRLGLTKPFGVHARPRPLFAVVDARPEEALATYADGSVAVALRRGSGGASLFVGAPGVTPELLRIAVHAAGAHLFTSRDCCVYANGPFVALHAVSDGPVQVNVGRNAPVFDALTGQSLGRGPILSVSIQKGQNRILRIGRPPG